MDRLWRCRVVLAIVVAALVAGAGPARALTDEEIFREFRFNLINPGARALGLGGAYVGIADDASAAQANPAGLYILDAPEFFGEFRAIRDDTRNFSATLGSLDVDPDTGERELPFLGLTSVSDSETVSEPTFLGVAWPFRLGAGGRRLTIAQSRQVLLTQQRSLTSGDQATGARFSFDTFPNTVNEGRVEAYAVETPTSGSSDMEIVYWNLGAGLEVHPDFAVGATLSYATLDITADTVTQVDDPLELFLDPSHPRLPATPSSDLYRTRIDDSDGDFVFAVGIHWHPDTVFAGGVSPWRFGAVFRQGASFQVTEATLLNEVGDETFENTIVVPDRYTLGFSYRARERWLLTVEAERVEFSDLLEDFRSGVNFLTSGRVADGAFATAPAETVAFTVDDGTIPRIGVEYAFSSFGRRDVAVQAGYYNMPDSRIRMATFNATDPEVDAVYLDAFRGGEDVSHLTVGGGVRFGRSRLQAAGDFSDDGSQVVASYIFNWARRTNP